MPSGAASAETARSPGRAANLAHVSRNVNCKDNVIDNATRAVNVRTNSRDKIRGHGQSVGRSSDGRWMAEGCDRSAVPPASCRLSATAGTAALRSPSLYRSRVAATACGPRRASRGSTRAGGCISSPVGETSGQTVTGRPPYGAQTLRPLAAFPRLARHGPQDCARFAGFGTPPAFRLTLVGRRPTHASMRDDGCKTRRLGVSGLRRNLDDAGVTISCL